MNAPYLKSTGAPLGLVPICPARSVKSTPPIASPMGGMMTSATREFTILPKAPPITTPTARSTTLPFIANSLNSDAIPICVSPRDQLNPAACLGRCLLLPLGLRRIVIARRCRFFLGRFLLRRRILIGPLGTLALGGRVFRARGRLHDSRAVHELHERHRRRITGPRHHAQDAGVAARAGTEARTQVGEQLVHDGAVAQPRKRQAAVRVAVGLAERDQRLDHAPQLLRLGDGGANRLVPQQ